MEIDAALLPQFYFNNFLINLVHFYIWFYKRYNSRPF